jgi:hypothetical protein
MGMLREVTPIQTTRPRASAVMKLLVPAESVRVNLSSIPKPINRLALGALPESSSMTFVPSYKKPINGPEVLASLPNRFGKHRRPLESPNPGPRRTHELFSPSGPSEPDPR